MRIYTELLLVSCVVVYVVDLSGWTSAWLGWLSRFTQRRGYPAVKELRPFSCSLCMVWWCCLVWAWLRGSLGLPTVAASAGLSFFSGTIREVFIFIQETLELAVSRLNRRLNG